MVQALRGEGVRQCADNVILTDQSVKRTWTPFARKDQISHEICGLLTKITNEIIESLTTATHTSTDKAKEASLTSALFLHDYGCFVPDLTRFAAEPCEGARQAPF